MKAIPQNNVSMLFTMAALLLFCNSQARAQTPQAGQPVPFAPALLHMDRQDYPPGAAAFITGTGFAGGETVVLQVLHADGTPGHGMDHNPWGVIARENGTFETSWHVCEDDCLNSQLLLCAAGQDSGAQANLLFTDAVPTSDVQLQPGTLRGTVILTGGTVQRVYAYAYSQDGFSSSSSSSGDSYSLTVAGDKRWNLQVQASLAAPTSLDTIYLWINPTTPINVPQGATLTSDVLCNLAPIHGSISVIGGTLRGVEINTTASDSSAWFQGDYRLTLTGPSFDLPMPLDHTVAVSGNATVQLPDASTVVVPLLPKSVALSASGANAAWTIDLSGDALGSISGQIVLTGPVSANYHYAYLSGSGLFKSQYVPGTTYEFTGLAPAQFYTWVDSYFAAPYFYLRLPYPQQSLYGQVTVSAGQNTQLDYVRDLAFVQGKLALNGFYDLSKANQASVSASGVYGTPSFGGYAQDYVLANGAFDLVATPGDWTLNWSGYFRDYSNASQPVDCSYSASDASPFSVSAGSDTTRPDLNGTTVVAQVNLDVLEAPGQQQQLVTSSQVSGYSYEYGPGNRLMKSKSFYARGPAYAQATPAVQIVAEPGTYTVTAQGLVNGSWVVFGTFPLTLSVPQITPVGANVTIQPSQDVPLSLTFDNVTAPGVTTVTQVPIGPKTPPPGFQLGVPGKGDIFYDITTTAQFSGSVRVCLTYSDAGMSVNQEQHLKLLHYNATTGKYEDITTGNVDTQNNVICGTTTSFSVFALAYTTDPEITSLDLPQGFVLAGNSVSASANFVDADNPNDAHSAKWIWGDGSETTGTVDEATGIIRGHHTYSASGVYPVQVIVADAALNRASLSGSISVNTAPTALCRDVTVQAGVNCSAEALVDAGSSDPDGDAVIVTQSPPGPYPLGTTAVTLVVRDSKGAATECKASVIVVDTTPPVADVAELPIITEQCSATLLSRPTATDACRGLITGTTTDPMTYTTEGTHVITWHFNDGNGNESTQTQTIVIHDSTPPSIACPGNVITYAEPLACSAIVTGISPVQAEDNCSVASITYDLAGATTGHGVNDASGTRFNTGETLVTYSITDHVGLTATSFFTVTVKNAAPLVTLTEPSSGVLVPVNTSVPFSGSFTDSAGGTHSGAWTIGAVQLPATIIEPNGSTPGTAKVTYTFTSAGVYKVKLTVIDSCGATATAGQIDGIDMLVVVYDPSGGFVTGGGWFQSPAGAYPVDPLATGKATFGFVSKYQRGANLPTGNTEFQFQAAELRFSSTSYQWLVVSGAKAQYKGTGTINGAGNFGFLLTATDGQITGGGGVDRFRIKIWDTATGTVVYDNAPGSDDLTSNTQQIAGGSIVIHK